MSGLKTRRGLLVAMLATVLVFGLVQQALAERTIALSTGTIDLALAQGGTAKQSIMVANNGDEPLSAMVYASDIKYQKDGSPKYVKPTGAAGEILHSPASWLTLRLPASTQVIANTPYIELKPGEETELKFEVNVPADATPGDYNAVVFFEMFDTTKSSAGTTSKVSGRIGARVVVRVAGDIVDSLELAPYSVRNFVIGDVVPYKFTLTNAGNVDKHFTPSLVVLDGSEAERMRSVLETSAVVYAQNARVYSGALKLRNAAFGKYTMRAEIVYDKETGSKPGATTPAKVTKDRTIFVIPVWVAIVAAIIVALPVLWVFYRLSNAIAAAGEKRRAARRSKETGMTDGVGTGTAGADKE